VPADDLHDHAPQQAGGRVERVAVVERGDQRVDARRHLRQPGGGQPAGDEVADVLLGYVRHQ
jgi:hypothetical protein